MIRTLSILGIVLAALTTVSGQKATDVIATVNGSPVTASNLPPDVLQDYLELKETVSKTRRDFFVDFVAEIVIEEEARARGVTPRALTDAEITSKVSEPRAEYIEAFYRGNPDAFDGRTLDQVRPVIAAYLKNIMTLGRRDEFVEALKPKFKVAPGKEIEAAGPDDTVLTISGRTITRRSFDDRFGIRLFEVEAGFYDRLSEAVDSTVLNTLLNLEASSRNIDAGQLIASEVTDKMRDFSEEERVRLVEAFIGRLRSKYKVESKVQPPVAPRAVIDTAGEPATGPAQAPVTLVMFTDFECPSCAAAHPVVNSVVAAYAGKVRLVVKDFPLSIHPQAVPAARAANAASKQGKYAAYTELLYANQRNLSVDSLRAYAKGIGLDMGRFEVDFTDPRGLDEVLGDYAEGEAVAVNGTPTFFVNGIKVRGGATAENLRAAIDSALMAANATKK